MQLMARYARRRGRAGAAARVRPRDGDGRRRPSDGRDRCSSPTCRPRFASGPATATSSPPRRPASRSSRPAPTRRWPRWRTPSAGCTRCCSTRKSCTPSSGLEILRNFAYGVCGCTGDWTMASFVEEATARIRAQVGDGRVVCALSGGVDSTVAALIIHRAIGDRLTCIFVDNGVLRLDEAAQIRQAVRAAAAAAACSSTRRRCFSSGWPASPIRSRSARSSARRSSTCSKRKRRSSGQVDFLAQGTLYPDVIESVAIVGQSALIKSHHNVGGLPERMRMKLVEPLRELFKDEVRAVGRKLGLEEEFVVRQPFPGPGLAVRILGEVTPAAARPAAAGRRHRRGRGASATAGTRGCGRASRCCCRCRASA